jgi:hypothetical protein
LLDRFKPFRGKRPTIDPCCGTVVVEALDGRCCVGRNTPNDPGEITVLEGLLVISSVEAETILVIVAPLSQSTHCRNANLAYPCTIPTFWFAWRAIVGGIRREVWEGDVVGVVENNAALTD